MSTTTKTLGAIADEVLALAAKATSEPWITVKDDADLATMEGDDSAVFYLAPPGQHAAYPHTDELCPPAEAEYVCQEVRSVADRDYIAHTRTSAPALARGVKELEERLRVAEDIIRSMPCDCRHDGDGMTATCNRCNALARIAAPVEVPHAD